MRRCATGACGVIALLLTAQPALACAGLVAPNGAVKLLRTSTLAAYADGVEHYVTSFEFSGKGGAQFGSIVPLPGIPSNVRKGGAWTLQRLQEETQPQPEVLELSDQLAFASAAPAKVILEKEIAALDITVLEGGARAVGDWAENNEFLLPPDAPEVLDFYAQRSPIFMAVEYDIQEAKKRNLTSGDGTPVHVSIPTPNPWVPLRILGLGRGANEPVEADVYLLTEREPALLPAAGTTMDLETSEEATPLLLKDLRSDRGMEWLPENMWLTYLKIDARAGDLTHDLAIDATGTSRPSPVAAGLVDPPASLPSGSHDLTWWAVALGLVLAAAFVRGADRLLADR